MVIPLTIVFHVCVSWDGHRNAIADTVWAVSLDQATVRVSLVNSTVRPQHSLISTTLIKLLRRSLLRLSSRADCQGDYVVAISLRKVSRWVPTFASSPVLDGISDLRGLLTFLLQAKMVGLAVVFATRRFHSAISFHGVVSASLARCPSAVRHVCRDVLRLRWERIRCPAGSRRCISLLT